MATKQPHSKRVLIDKANSSMVASIAVACFLIMFAIVSGRALWSQRNFQARVISEKEKAVAQLDTNIQEVEKLEVSYKEFIGAPDNVIGGNPAGTGDRDGNNAKIVLDALPSKYDFPALISSIEKVLSAKNYSLNGIGGTDDEVAQSAASSKDPVEMPFQLESTVASYDAGRDLLSTLELSIRPIRAKKLSLTGGDEGLGIQLEAVSYYKPARGLTIEKKEIK